MPRPDRRVLAAIFLGGCAGAALRAGLVQAFPTDPGDWPWVTFAINVAGAFLLGLLAARVSPGDVRRSLLGVGLCGAMTTFATMQIELLDMLDESRLALAAGYVAASVAAGLLAVSLATRMARPAAA